MDSMHSILGTTHAHTPTFHSCNSKLKDSQIVHVHNPTLLDPTYAEQSEVTIQDVLFLECFTHLKSMIRSFDTSSAKGKELLSIIGQLCTDDKISSIVTNWSLIDPTYLQRYAHFLVLTVILGSDLAIEEDRLLLLGQSALFYVPQQSWNLFPSVADFFARFDNRLRNRLSQIWSERYAAFQQPGFEMN